MPKYLVERNIPGAGTLSADDLTVMAQKWCRALEDLGPAIQWVESFITDNKVYCIYFAPSERLVLEHTQLCGFPAGRISELRAVIDPSMAREDEHDMAKEAGVY
jgi:hypothetical protein